MTAEGAEIFGDRCDICGSEKYLALHQKQGTHNGKGGGFATTLILAKKDPENWVRLCIQCHKAVHWCMLHFGMSWEEIKEKLRDP